VGTVKWRKGNKSRKCNALYVIEMERRRLSRGWKLRIWKVAHMGCRANRMSRINIIWLTVAYGHCENTCQSMCSLEAAPLIRCMGTTCIPVSFQSNPSITISMERSFEALPFDMAIDRSEKQTKSTCYASVTLNKICRITNKVFTNQFLSSFHYRISYC